MVTKLFVVSAAIVILGITSQAAAQYRQHNYGYGYGHHFHPYYQQQQPQFGGYQQTGYQQNGFQQNAYQQQPPPSASVQEAEWVCKNPKTGDMMIIATDTFGSRNSGPVEWHQVNLPNNQANSVKPQPAFGNPTFSQISPIYSTTEKAPNPFWPNNNNYQPNQPQVNPTTEAHTNIEREPGTLYTTTPRSVGPIWPGGDEKNNNNNGNNGFTIADVPTTGKSFFNNPFFDSTQKPQTTVTTTTTEPTEDGPIEIILGK